jgi:cytochrome c-type biogenesis protein CcmH/NrfG
MRCAVRTVIFLVFFAIASVCAAGQDLGSSNKLFGGAKTAPTKTKKPPAKRKATPTRAKTQLKATAPSRSKTQPNPSTPVVKAERSVAKKPEKVASTVKEPAAKTERPTGINPPSNAAADALYEKLIDDGNIARDDRNYSAAEAAYQRAKSIKPRDSRAVFGLGNLYSDQQRWDDAESAYRSAMKLEPDSAVIYIALSYVLSQPIIVSNLGERYEEAERLARRSTELDPHNALALDQLGVAMELRGLISADTENAYRMAIRLQPSFAPPYAHLGRLLRRRGDAKGSAVAYENAVRYSTNVATMILVADVMQSEQRYADSEPLLRAAVANDPRNPTGLLLLGQALTTTGKYADAEKYLRRSLDVSPNGFMSNSLLGTLYLRQNKFESAENALRQALRSVSSNEKRRLSLQFEKVGDGYLNAGTSANAQRAYRQAADLDAENESVNAKLAKARHS